MSEALAHVVSTAGRVLEDRLTLWGLELRRSVEHGVRVGMWRAGILATSTCAVGLGAAAVIWGLSHIMSIGLALGVAAMGFGIAAAGLSLAARRAARADEPRALAPVSGARALSERRGA